MSLGGDFCCPTDATILAPPLRKAFLWQTSHSTGQTCQLTATSQLASMLTRKIPKEISLCVHSEGIFQWTNPSYTFADLFISTPYPYIYIYYALASSNNGQSCNTSCSLLPLFVQKACPACHCLFLTQCKCQFLCVEGSSSEFPSLSPAQIGSGTL